MINWSKVHKCDVPKPNVDMFQSPSREKFQIFWGHSGWKFFDDQLTALCFKRQKATINRKICCPKFLLVANMWFCLNPLVWVTRHLSFQFAVNSFYSVLYRFDRGPVPQSSTVGTPAMQLFRWNIIHKIWLDQVNSTTLTRC